MKKTISFLLIFATVLSCFIFTVSANEGVISDEGRLPFEDVKDSHWFHDAVEFCFSNSVIKGMNEYTFGWTGNLTRAQFVTMLATIDGADLTQYSVTKFQDVKSSHWYYGAVAWAFETELTSGLSETKFGPNQPITRAQIARFMWIYMEDKFPVEINDSCLDQFADVSKVQAWAKDGMKYAVSAGLISGMQKNNKLCVAPNDMTTRAQTAVIFKNAIEKYFCGDCDHSFTTADCTNAAECTKCGMVNGLPNGHTLSVYNCTTGGKCLVCSANVAPSKLLHNYAAATCTAPMTCTYCHATKGSAKGHSFKAATCTAPKTCTKCKATEGKALGHTYSGNYCTRCKDLSPYGKVSYYIKSKGIYDSSSNTYTYFKTHTQGAVAVAYDATTGELGLVFIGMYSNGDQDTSGIFLPKSGTTCRFEYFYDDYSGGRMFEGYGYIEAKTYNEYTTVSFADYDGGVHNLSTARENAAYEIHLALADADSLLNELGGVSIKDFGFANY